MDIRVEYTASNTEGYRGKLKDIYEGRKGTKKVKLIYGFRDLFYERENIKDDRWHTKVTDFNLRMRTGFDIRTCDLDSKSILAEIYNVRVKPENEELYIGNCKLKTCDCEWSSVIKCQLCPRQMFTSDEVDKEWKKWNQRTLKKKLTEEKQSRESEESRKALQGVDIDISLEDFKEKNDEDVEYLPKNKFTTPVTNKSQYLRSHEKKDSTEENLEAFPQIWKKNIKPQIDDSHCPHTEHVQGLMTLSTYRARTRIDDTVHIQSTYKD